MAIARFSAMGTMWSREAEVFIAPVQEEETVHEEEKENEDAMVEDMPLENESEKWQPIDMADSYWQLFNEAYDDLGTPVPSAPSEWTPKGSRLPRTTSSELMKMYPELMWRWGSFK